MHSSSETAIPPTQRILVFGAAGFVGQHLCALAERRGHTVVRAGRTRGERVDIVCDVCDMAAVESAVSAANPTAIANLAGFSSVGKSFREPITCFATNALGALHVIDAAHRQDTGPYLLAVSSGDVYGDVSLQKLPARETLEPRPQSPYSASKAAMEAICCSYAAAGLLIGVPRAFNHTGPGQAASFSMPGFAAQLARAKQAGHRTAALRTGNLTLVRDFTDVRDVVKAYLTMIEQRLVGTYNVCSGQAHTLLDMVTVLSQLSGIDVTFQRAPERLRNNEPQMLYGSPEKLVEATGWAPEVPMRRTLRDLFLDISERTRFE